MMRKDLAENKCYQIRRILENAELQNDLPEFWLLKPSDFNVYVSSDKRKSVDCIEYMIPHKQEGFYDINDDLKDTIVQFLRRSGNMRQASDLMRDL